jgi:hypothetical protein
VAVAVVVQPEIIVRLEEHVAELRVGDAVLARQSVLDALASEHLVDRHELADLAQEVEVGDRRRPVAVVDELAPDPTDVDDPADLLLDRGHISRQRLRVEQVPFL